MATLAADLGVRLTPQHGGGLTANDSGPGWPPLESCPTCRGRLVDHQYLDLGSALPVSDEEAFINDAIDDSAWERLRNHRTVEAVQPGCVVFRALRCADGQGAVVPVALARDVYGDDAIQGMVYGLSRGQIDTLTSEELGVWRPYAACWDSR
jgi:hypothetical protein